MIDMADRANIAVRLVAVEFLFAHFYNPVLADI
jgi:hypothetical protein